MIIHLEVQHEMNSQKTSDTKKYSILEHPAFKARVGNIEETSKTKLLSFIWTNEMMKSAYKIHCLP